MFSKDDGASADKDRFKSMSYARQPTKIEASVVLRDGRKQDETELGASATPGLSSFLVYQQSIAIVIGTRRHLSRDELLNVSANVNVYRTRGSRMLRLLQKSPCRCGCSILSRLLLYDFLELSFVNRSHTIEGVRDLCYFEKGVKLYTGRF